MTTIAASTAVPPRMSAAGIGLAAGQFLYNRFLADLYRFGPLLSVAVPVIGATLTVFFVAAYILNIPDVRQATDLGKRRK